MDQDKMKIRNNFNWTRFWQEQSLIVIKMGSWYGHWVCLRLFGGLDVKTFLEMGGGPGYLTKLIAQKSGYEPTLVENDPVAYELFKKISNFGHYVLKDFFEYESEKNLTLSLVMA